MCQISSFSDSIGSNKEALSNPQNLKGFATYSSLWQINLTITQKYSRVYNTKEHLHRAIDSITKAQKAKGNTISEHQIAERAGVPVDTLTAYLTGNLLIPDNFVVELMAKYGGSFGTVHHIVKLEIPDWDFSDNEIEE